jgi:GTPase SAR1 family protein
MTRRSIYLLVLEARKDAETDKQVRQWLERIKAFGGDSSVIIVGNKIDLNPSFGIDTTSLQKDYPQIKQFVNVSSQSGENIEKLKSILEEFIPKAELFDTEIDERWIDIKNELQRLTGDKSKLSHEEFKSICDKHNLPSLENQNQAINFLNDLGIVLHFDELNLSEYYVLDPLWVTVGVYRILTSGTAARKKGELNIADLPRVVNEEHKESEGIKHRAIQAITYSPNECRFLADIMAQFKLSYYSDQNKKILIPDLLNKETPKEESERFNYAEEKLSLIYEYKYMPSSIIPRLIVELKNDVAISWRTGTILKCHANISAEAMITSLNNSLTIIVLGDYKQKRDYLSILRYFINQINSSFKVEVTLKIPLPNNEKYNEKYDTLVKMEKAGERIYRNWEIEKDFEISRLLDGIVSSEDLQRQIQKYFITYNMGDTYNTNQAGAVGPFSSANNNTLNQLINNLPDNADYALLTQELAALKQKLIDQAATPEQYKAIANVAEAEIAAQKKDGNQVLKALTASGKWVLDIAKDLGTSVLSEIIKKHMGM